MKYKKNFFVIISGVVSSLLITIIINYLLNPYGVFKKYKNYNVSTQVNERYLKTSYVIDNPQKYDSFILGSSRVGVLEGEKLDKIGRFYNMTFSGALPVEILDILETFEEKQVNIKNIILGIDDFDFYKNPISQENVLYKISYRKIEENRFNLWKYYLLKNPISRINRTYLTERKNEKGKVFYDIVETGKWKREYPEKEIEKNIKNHRENLSKVKLETSDTDRIEESILEIENIVKFCKKNKIKLTVIYLPRYVNSYNANKEIIEKSKIELQKITDYWDFVVLDGYTNDEYYWYEYSHYRPNLGRMIFKRIFKEQFNEDVQIPNNFGEYKKKLK